MSDPMVLMPDPFAAVLPAVQAFLNGRAEAYAANVKVGVQLVEDPTRYVWVRRVGGRSNDVVLDNPRLDFLVWHDGKVSDRVKLANLVRAFVLSMNGTYSGVYVTNVSEFMGPADMPDPSDPQATVTMFTVTLTTRGTELSA